MASSYTANNGIEKIGTGEQAGTWGATTNTNFDILDRAINGVGAITLSGTTHTLTTTDGALSDGHFKVLVFAPQDIQTLLPYHLMIKTNCTLYLTIPLAVNL